MNDQKVYLIDDDKFIEHTFQRVFKKNEISKELVVYRSFEAALQSLKKDSPSIVFLDFFLPGLNGLGALSRILEIIPECKVVMLSNHDDESIQRKLVENGALKFVSKQYDEIEECLSVLN